MNQVAILTLHQVMEEMKAPIKYQVVTLTSYKIVAQHRSKYKLVQFTK